MPTSPPTLLLSPPTTFPLANECVMLPMLMPTRPPAKFWPTNPPGASPTVTFANELDCEIVVLLVFVPTRPPATMLLNNPPLTVPLRTCTFWIVPSLTPATGPIDWPLAVALIVTLVSVRFWTVPVAPMTPNNPPGEAAELVRLAMVKPCPSSEPVKMSLPVP